MKEIINNDSLGIFFLILNHMFSVCQFRLFAQILVKSPIFFFRFIFAMGTNEIDVQAKKMGRKKEEYIKNANCSFCNNFSFQVLLFIAPTF